VVAVLAVSPVIAAVVAESAESRVDPDVESSTTDESTCAAVELDGAGPREQPNKKAKMHTISCSLR
jgi:hypothetical protein